MIHRSLIQAKAKGSLMRGIYDAVMLLSNLDYHTR